MLIVDKQLLTATKGMIGQPLEDAILKLSPSKKLHHGIFGAILPIDQLLLTKAKALNLIFSTAQKYWGNVELFLYATLQESAIDLENANDRLAAFFSSPRGKKAIWDYFAIHNRLAFENL
ncbi:MAG TPA: hypothetical protein VNQ57_05115, partial [Ureibacillus sp.]|nr:hypothetical protein [Ureibacillus sp.]